MERLTRHIIGSSNINRFYKKENFPGFKECKMIKCCREEVFKVRMDDLVSEVKEVIISVIENFITDAVGNTKDEKVSIYCFHFVTFVLKKKTCLSLTKIDLLRNLQSCYMSHNLFLLLITDHCVED